MLQIQFRTWIQISYTVFKILYDCDMNIWRHIQYCREFRIGKPVQVMWGIQLSSKMANSSNLIICAALACISSTRMISTAQWLRATKSTFTPYEPAHRRSPEMALSPIESLRSREHGARKSHVRFNFQHNRQTPNHNAHRRNSHPAVFPQLTCCLEKMASPFCCFQLPWPGMLPLTLT